MDYLCNPGHDSLWTSIDPDIIKGLPAAFVALVIGAIAAAIAARQFLVAKAKLNLDLFERRLAIYQRLRHFLSIQYEGKADRQLDVEFLNGIHEAYFLFGAELGDYMHQMVEKTSELLNAQVELTETQKPEERGPLVAKVRAQREFFGGELRDIRTRFGKYMDFAEWR